MFNYLDMHMTKHTPATSSRKGDVDVLQTSAEIVADDLQDHIPTIGSDNGIASGGSLIDSNSWGTAAHSVNT